MNRRRIGDLEIRPIGLGCMSLSHAYGTPPSKDHSVALLNMAVDLGYDFLDTAALYGFGTNESLIGEALRHRRQEFRLASKCGMTGINGTRVIDGRPETLRRTLEESLRRLQTDYIDLYYLHRWDKTVPIEESVGALADAIQQGKIGAIGLSEVSAATLRRAASVHSIAAVQNEYSPWSRNVELGLLDTTKELGTAMVAFSPVGRGFFAGRVQALETLEPTDLRRSMPRFSPDNLHQNVNVYRSFAELSERAGCTPSQLSLAWVLSRGGHVVAIPGTTSMTHLEENFAAQSLQVSDTILASVESVVNRSSVLGERYAEATLSEVDTESWDGS